MNEPILNFLAGMAGFYLLSLLMRDIKAWAKIVQDREYEWHSWTYTGRGEGNGPQWPDNGQVLLAVETEKEVLVFLVDVKNRMPDMYHVTQRESNFRIVCWRPFDKLAEFKAIKNQFDAE